MGIVKIVFHVADIHIRLYKRHEEYREQLQKFYDGVKSFIGENKLNGDECRIVIAGDCVHSKNHMTPELIYMVSWFLSECANICKTIIIPGNHDLLVNNLDRMDALTPIIQALNNNNIVYYTDTGCYEDENVIWCVYSQLTGSDRPDIESAKEEFGDKTYIGLFHDPIVGLKTDVGFEFDDGVSSDHFDGLDYTLCGDIHKREVLFNSEGRPVIMVGSMIQQSYGENPEGHGYCIIDVENDSYEFTDIPNDYGFYTFVMDSIDDIENETYRLKT